MPQKAVESTITTKFEFTYGNSEPPKRAFIHVTTTVQGDRKITSVLDHTPHSSYTLEELPVLYYMIDLLQSE
jgi:hypothetical protein